MYKFILYVFLSTNSIYADVNFKNMKFHTTLIKDYSFATRFELLFSILVVIIRLYTNLLGAIIHPVDNRFIR